VYAQLSNSILLPYAIDAFANKGNPEISLFKKIIGERRNKIIALKKEGLILSKEDKNSIFNLLMDILE
jgi:hypothetical protein